jgi:hypothetical protein
VRSIGMPFDGIIYRSLKEAPSADEAERINKRFAKRVKDLIDEHRRKKARVKIEPRSAV